jgi:hypothetical protein
MTVPVRSKTLHFRTYDNVIDNIVPYPNEIIFYSILFMYNSGYFSRYAGYTH